MKKILLSLTIIFILFSACACSVETAAEHESNKALEAESIENLGSDNSEETSVVDSESETETIPIGSSTTATTNSSNITATTVQSSAEDSTITVYLTVKCAAAAGYKDLGLTLPSDGYFCFDKEITIHKGDTVYNVLYNADALSYIDASIESSFAYGKYLSGINGLYEKKCGSDSGWKYIITGNSSPLSISSVKPSNGDHIDFFYALTSTDTYD